MVNDENEMAHKNTHLGRSVEDLQEFLSSVLPDLTRSYPRRPVIAGDKHSAIFRQPQPQVFCLQGLVCTQRCEHSPHYSRDPCPFGLLIIELLSSFGKVSLKG